MVCLLLEVLGLSNKKNIMLSLSLLTIVFLCNLRLPTDNPVFLVDPSYKMLWSFA